jgi:ribose transport system permease protein
MNTLTHRLKMTLLGNQWVFLLAVVIILSVIAGVVNPRYFTVRNMSNLLEQIAVLGLVACGATILIVSGNFDISVGANIGLSASVMAVLMRSGVPPFVAAGIGLVVAIGAATFIGGCSIAFHAPSFIISLASIGVFQGIALALTGGTLQTIYGQFEALGGTRVFDIIPVIFLISLVGFLATHSMLTHTQLGRRVYAIGNNARAAFLAGIRVNANRMIFFFLNGLLVGVAAMLLLSRVGAAQPTTGSGIELQAIGSAVVGGTPMSGGRGKIIGTFFGVLLWGVIANALNMMRVDPYFQDIIFGLLIVLAVAVSSLRLRIQQSLMA